MSLRLSVAQASAIGPRAENQDALRVVTPVADLAASKGYLCAMADGVSQCADGGLAARSTLQALALDYYATPQTWGVAQALERFADPDADTLELIRHLVAQLRPRGRGDEEVAERYRAMLDRLARSRWRREPVRGRGSAGYSRSNSTLRVTGPRILIAFSPRRTWWPIACQAR